MGFYIRRTSSELDTLVDEPKAQYENGCVWSWPLISIIRKEVAPADKDNIVSKTCLDFENYRFCRTLDS